MIAFFTRHPTAANLLMFALLVLGLTSLPNLKRETFPEYSPPYISVRIVYPGASPLEVEQQICRRIEDALDGLSDIEELRCQSLEGVATATLKLDKHAQMQRMLVDVQTQVNAVDDFPTDVESIVVQELDWKEPVVDIALSAEMPLPDLKQYAEQLKEELKRDYGIALVDITGFSDHQWLVEVNVNALRALGLTISDIATQLTNQTKRLPAGTLETRSHDILLRFGQSQYSIEQMKNIVIAARSDGSQVRLTDVATITDRFEDKASKILFDDKPAAIIKVYKRKQDDALRIKQQVQAFVDAQTPRLPDGIALTLSNDLSSVLWDRLSMMIKNGGQGIVLVFATMWLFFSFRYSLWVALGLPAAFLGGLFVMAQLGFSINVMSLVGLLMAIGIMMDDSIVIAESIAAHIDRGEPVDEAVIKGVRQVLPGVVSSFLTTLCIFGGLLFLDGQIGAVLKAVPQVLIVVLTLSLVEAFWILPHHLYSSLHHHKEDSQTSWKVKRKLLQRFEHFRNVTLVKAVDQVLHYRYLFLSSIVAMLLVAFAALISGVVKFQPFPALDGDVIEARLTMPPGTPLVDTEQVIAAIADSGRRAASILDKKNSESAPLLQHLTEQYNHNADANEKGAHLATVRIDLLTAEARNTTIDGFIAQWQKELGEQAGPIAVVFKQPAMGPGGRAVDFRMMHKDLKVLKQAAVDTQRYLRAMPGISGVVDNMRLGKPEYVLALKPGAESFGVTAALVARQLRSAVLGVNADEIRIGNESIDIDVRLNESQLDERAELENLPIYLPDGRFFPLSQLVTIRSERNYVAIERIDGLRAVSVYAETQSGVISSTDVNQRLQNELQPQLMKKYPGIRFASDGEAKDAAQTGASMGKGFILGLLGVFAILSYQFKSYLEPVVVMLAIPLALIGVIAGHGLLGYAISMPSIMGFISLAGIVVNDSILLVQYIRQHLDQGQSLHQSLVQASRERFRAVFLTSMTTAAGLLPLLSETSLQAQVLKPLVIAIVFGVFSSTLLVIFMVPAAYRVLADFGWLKNVEVEKGA
jgi:multidrug efflux pump subunit AcrB